MKLGIVTVYQSYNCGSFLQAYALQKALTELGADASFVKSPFAVESRLWFRLLQGVKYICTGKLKRAKHLLKTYANFKNARERLPVVSGYTDLDGVVYGSDTIWNLDDPYFLKHWRRFSGADHSGAKIAYGASVGSTALQELLSRKELCEAVSSFRSIGVRDRATYEFVKACCGEDRQVTFVVDPTMLLPRTVYESLAAPIAQSGYILFYHFGAIAENVKKQVRAFADETGRKIVVFGEDTGWADVYVSNDPFLMLGYYKNADYVITNTFHGNIFSIIFNKQFISFGKEKQKVCALLAQFGLTDRLAEPDAEITPLLEQMVDFTSANEKREELRQTSLEFLEQQIMKVKGA